MNDQIETIGASCINSGVGFVIPVNIVQIDSQPVRSFDDLLIYATLKTNPGQVEKLSLLRNGKIRRSAYGW